MSIDEEATFWAAYLETLARLFPEAVSAWCTAQGRAYFAARVPEKRQEALRAEILRRVDLDSLEVAVERIDGTRMTGVPVKREDGTVVGAALVMSGSHADDSILNECAELVAAVGSSREHMKHRARRLAHDVGNELTTVDVASQVLLAQHKDDERLASRVTLVREATRRTLLLVDEFTAELGVQSRRLSVK